MDDRHCTEVSRHSFSFFLFSPQLSILVAVAQPAVNTITATAMCMHWNLSVCKLLYPLCDLLASYCHLASNPTLIYE